MRLLREVWIMLWRLLLSPSWRDSQSLPCRLVPPVPPRIFLRSDQKLAEALKVEEPVHKFLRIRFHCLERDQIRFAGNWLNFLVNQPPGPRVGVTGICPDGRSNGRSQREGRLQPGFRAGHSCPLDTIAVRTWNIFKPL